MNEKLGLAAAKNIRFYQNTVYITFFLLIVIAMHSCVLSPQYARPGVEVPETWRVSVNESSSYANYDWWKQFQDPVLNRLIDEALENNNDLKMAIFRVDEFFGQFLMASSSLYPQFNITGQALRQEFPVALNPISTGMRRTFTEYNSFFNLSYELDIWGRFRSASEAALSELLAQVELRRVVVQTLVTSLASAYVKLRQFDQQHYISQETFRSRKEAYELTVARYEGELTSELEVKLAEAAMENAEVQKIQFEILVGQQEDLLSVLIGHPSQSIERGLRLDELVLLIDLPAGLPSEVLEQRPDILQAEQLLKAANAQIGVARAQFFPKIPLTGFYGNESLQLHNLFTGPARVWEYAASLLQPLFTGGLLTGQLEVAVAQKWEAYYAYRQTVLKAFQEVNDALIAHDKTKELLVVQQRQVAALKGALHLANLQYANGQVDYLNVLDAERNLFDVQLNLAQVQSDVFLSLINLYKALGGGWIIEADSQALENYEPCFEIRPL